MKKPSISISCLSRSSLLEFLLPNLGVALGLLGGSGQFYDSGESCRHAKILGNQVVANHGCHGLHGLHGLEG